MGFVGERAHICGSLICADFVLESLRRMVNCLVLKSAAGSCGVHEHAILQKRTTMSIDTIGDFLTIMRNGLMISRPSVTAPYSKLKYQLALVLQQEGFIRSVAVDESKRSMVIGLKYVSDESVIHEIKRISKPGRRAYTGSSSIAPVIGGLGISILTTNRGVMTDKQAQALSVGGELICTVW